MKSMGIAIVLVFIMAAVLIGWAEQDGGHVDDLCFVQITDLETGDHAYIVAAGVPAKQFCTSFGSGNVAGFWVTQLKEQRVPDQTMWCMEPWFENGERIGEWAVMSGNERLGTNTCAGIASSMLARRV